ncbi:MAG: hypothetical protein MZV64_48395 [Ignavibacteriales bacterium]|nr:hypothetical protein [Ignavibacteriales bacterium]
MGQETSGFRTSVKNKEGLWIPVVSGKTRGSGHSVDFAPVTGGYFRLNLTGPNGELLL